MKFPIAATVLFSSCAAMASPISEVTIVTPRDAPFTDPTCKLSQPVGTTPLSFLFPTAVDLGNIIGPVLKGLIGEQNLEAIDKVADTLCVYVIFQDSLFHFSVDFPLSQGCLIFDFF